MTNQIAIVNGKNTALADERSLLLVCTIDK